MAASYSPLDRYRDYLEYQGLVLSESLSAQLESLANAIDWEEPKTAADYQATAVIALVEAELAEDEDTETRRLYIDLALEALENAFATGEQSLAAVQWGIVQACFGELSKAQQIAFRELVAAAEWAYQPNQPSCQLVYLPGEAPGSSGASTAEHLANLLQSPGLQLQRLILATEALCRSQLVLYNQGGARSLQALSLLCPDSVSLQRKMGIYKLANREPEGFMPLHKAHAQTASSATKDKLRSATALQLASWQYQSPEKAEIWAKEAQNYRETLAQDAESWRRASTNPACVYLPYDGDICFAAEPTLNSIVTRVLLAEGDWFEREMTLWRKVIQPGMTVIDVGANSGVYAFSAAKRVGPTGKVIAIEPFQGCVDCLRQTSKVNQLDWVTILQAAASDKFGSAYLKLHSASELNELTLDVPELGNENIQEIPLLTLDSLIEQENLSRLDVLKIDAEGHEVQVISGAAQLLADFKPLILYENIAGAQGSNLAVAQLLEEMNYELFAYKDFACNLVELNDKELGNCLNLIAINKSCKGDFHGL